MKSLQIIQKTFKVFKNLSRIGMIVSLAWAVLTLIGLLCGIAWHSGGTVTGAGQEALLTLTLTGSLRQMIGVLLSDLVFALTDSILLLSAFRYFRQEQADGTPFTQSGADQIKRLGILTIVLPLAAVILSALCYEVFDLSKTAMADQGNPTGVMLGIVLILASLLFRYGAELEESRRSLCE